MLRHWTSVKQMPVWASPTSITLHSLSPCWYPFHFTVWSLAGHHRVFWTHWLFSVVYEWRKNRKWGSSPAVSCSVNSQQLCGIFQQKHWTPVLHLHLRPLKSGPPSMATRSLFCKLIRHSATNCHDLLHCAPQAPLFSPLLLPMNPPQPSLSFCTPVSLPPQQCYAGVQ